MLEAYRKHVSERETEGLPPLPLDASQTAELVELIKNPPKGEEPFLLELFTHRVPPGVDQAAYVKAGFLTAITNGKVASPLIDLAHATELLGTMLGGYNIQPLVELLDNEELAPLSAKALSKTLLIFDAYHDIVEKSKTNSYAKQVVDAWANADWFTGRDPMPEEITVTVFKVDGETNTDDLSPASEAWSRPDIPLHAKA
ncbi:MAG: aconitate hydratase B, partial [Gammaproteobacteria bacterium]|nr:aconitate hydratase B [Gammaproteobacteria bacterium]